MRSELSDKQRAILDFVRTFLDENGYPPSIRDIQYGCNISSTSVVDYNLKALERLGYIRRGREVSRAIELLEERRNRRSGGLVEVPLLGTIAAGQPIPVPGGDTFTLDPEDVIEVSERVTRGRQNVFALRVKGQSMIDALINDGDIVFLEATDRAENGDVVAAWLKREQETTLKKYYHEGDRIRLQPMNQSMAPIYTSADNVAIQGRLIHVERSVL
jgi:repressor LexA